MTKLGTDFKTLLKYFHLQKVSTNANLIGLPLVWCGSKCCRPQTGFTVQNTARMKNALKHRQQSEKGYIKFTFYCNTGTWSLVMIFSQISTILKNFKPYC